MFKSLSIFKHNNAPVFIGDLDAFRFAPCTPSGDKSIGFVVPRGNGEHLAESVGKGTLVAIMVETKSVPASAIQSELDKAVAAIEQSTGRKPGKKEKRDLKEEIRAALLPSAFPKQTKVYVWLSSDGMLFIDNTSASKVDEVITLLVRASSEFATNAISTKTSPTVAMGTWLAKQDAPAGFALGKECELKSADESQAKVRYSHHPLMIGEVQAHLAQGKQPTCLALQWDDRVNFVLTDDLQLKKIKIQDKLAIQSTDAASDFDASMLIITGALVPAVESLIFEMGGEVKKADA